MFMTNKNHTHGFVDVDVTLKVRFHLFSPNGGLLSPPPTFAPFLPPLPGTDTLSTTQLWKKHFEYFYREEDWFCL